MSVTMATARDEMISRIVEVVGTIASQDRPTLFFENKDPSIPRNGDTPWAMAYIRHQGGEQASLAGASGTRMWDRTGTIVVQVNTKSGDAFRKNDVICQAIRDGFQGYTTPGGVWFRSPRVEEQGIEGSWFATNVLIDFLYTEIL